MNMSENSVIRVQGVPERTAFRKGKAMIHSKDAAGLFTWSDRLGPHGTTIETKRNDCSWDPKEGLSKAHHFWQQKKKECIASGNWHPEPVENASKRDFGGEKMSTDHFYGLADTESERAAQFAQIAMAQEKTLIQKKDREFYGPPLSAPIESNYKRPARVVALNMPVTSPFKLSRSRKVRQAAAERRSQALASEWNHMPLSLLRGKMHGPIDIRKEATETTVSCLASDVISTNSAGGSYRIKYWADEPFKVDGGRPQLHPGKVNWGYR